MAETVSQQRNEEGGLHTVSNVALAGTGLYVGNKIFNAATQMDSKPAQLYNHLLGTKYLERHMSAASMSWKTVDGTTLANQSVKKAMISQMLALEEASPLHILRTLQLSNIFMPFVDITESQDVIRFSPSKLKNQAHYYQAVIEYANREATEQTKRKLKEDALKQGLGFYKNTMYLLDEKGDIDKTSVVIPEARLSLSHLKHGQQLSRNAMVESYSKNLGTNIDYGNMYKDQLMFIGGKSNADLTGAWSKSWFRYTTEASMKSLDNPLGGIEDLLRGMGAGDTSIFESKAWLTAKKYLNVNMGSGGNYDLTLPEMYKRSAVNVAKKTTIGLLGYEIADSLVRTIAPADTLFNDGIYTGLTNLYASATLNIAEIWSDKFQGYKNSQEQIAPGSTSLLALAAIPMSGALMGSKYAYAKRLGKTALEDADKAAEVFSTKSTDTFLSKLGLAKEYTPMKKNALKGALIGAALAIPFLPGALVGESSEELRAQYSGEKEVAQKANRFWMMGGGEWNGTHTRYFTSHNVARVNADGTDKVRYGDDDTKKKLNPLLHPLAYIKNPYRYEEMHESDMPYPVWGMDVGYGSIYGKIYERTIGQIIKPDVINPAIREMAQEAEGMVEHSKYGVVANKLKSILVGDKNSIPMPVDGKMASMIKEGIARSPESANYDPNLEAAGLTFQAGADLIGLKGWAASLPLKDFGISSENVRTQLARSGEATSAARDFRDWNIGDAWGCFTPEMRVKTINGYVEIQNIKVGDLVLSKGGIYRPVKTVFIKDFIYAPLLNITTGSFKSTIRCTPDHVFPGLKREQYNCGHPKPLKDLSILDRDMSEYSVNDYLVIPKFEDIYFIEIVGIQEELYTGLMYDLEIDGSDSDNESDVNYYTVERVLCHNSGEYQRKILGTSAGSLMERYNPLTNNMASWLPKNPNQYYIDYSKGNAYSKIERGEERLTGKGYEALNPGLEGVDPEDYSLIYKYKILSDVAKGSREHIRARQQALQAYTGGALSKEESKILEQTLDQEVARDNRKTFKEQSTVAQRFNSGPEGLLQGALWDIVSTESPLEMLTPIRPIAKFIHNRTAIEDYIETQLGGSDAAIWTNPYSHFIKPAANKARLLAERNFKSQEVTEKENIDEYFDKLGTIKNLSDGNRTNDLNSVASASLSGLFTNEQVMKFKKSLNADQKDYFEAFSKEKDEKKRDKIRSILPEDVLRGYEQIWRNSDTAAKARSNGSSVQQAITDDFNRNTKVLAHSMNTKPLTREEKKSAAALVDADLDSYANLGGSRGERIEITQNEMLRKKISFQESAAYVHNTTGSPTSKFMGWDPRLTIDDIKIKTLSIGGEDLKRFGFWKKDEERMNSITALNDEDQVINSLSRIKADIHRNMMARQKIDSVLFSNGYKTRHISIADSNYGMLKFKEEE